MGTSTSVQSCGEAISRWWRSGSAKTVLLSAGVAAVGLYAVGDVVSGLLYDGYSHRDQAISELSAFGSPVRGLMVSAILIHGLLVIAFGVGVWRSADRRSLRLTGLLMVAAGLVGFPTHTVFAMSSRWMEAGFNDTMHIALSGIFSLLVSVAILASAVAYRGPFRFYAIATFLVLIGFGAAASLAIQGIGENVTPWAGAFERINAYAYFAWIVVLAVTMLRHCHDPTENAAAEGHERKPGPQTTRPSVPPTGKQVTVRSLDIATVANGKIVRHDFYFEQLDLLTQLGLMEEAARATT